MAPGAKTRLGFGEEPKPPAAVKLISLGLAIKRKNPWGLGTESPEELPPLLLTGFADSAPSQISLFRRIHVSALNFCMSLFR